jgi:hypothetical protein
MWLALGLVALVAMLFIGFGLNAWKALKLSNKSFKYVDKSKLKNWDEDGWDDQDDEPPPPQS